MLNVQFLVCCGGPSGYTKTVVLTLHHQLMCIPKTQRTSKQGITFDQNDTALITFCSKQPNILKEEIIGKMMKSL